MPATEPTQVLGSQLGNGPVPPPSPQKRSRLPFIIAGALGLVLVAAVATVILIVGSGGQTTSASAAYRAKLTAVMTPVVNSNVALSKATQAVNGSSATLKTAKDSVATTQQAVVGARGAVAAISVPASEQTLSQQTAQALTQEAGYLQALGSTLADPSNKSAGSLQALASGTNAAFVPLADVAPGGSTSIYGVDNVTSWVSGAQKKAQTPSVTNVYNNVTTTTTPASVTPPSPDTTDTVSSLTPTYCSNGIYVGSGASCGLAENVFDAVFAQWKDNGHVFPSSLYSVHSPVTGNDYDLTLYSSTPSWALYQLPSGSYVSIGEYALSVY